LPFRKASKALRDELLHFGFTKMSSLKEKSLFCHGLPLAGTTEQGTDVRLLAGFNDSETDVDTG
jgi:hypothetical protein